MNSKDNLKEFLYRAMGYLALFFFVVVVAFSALGHCQVSPFMGIGNVQFIDNNGKPLTAGVLYSYQGGTSTQQATFTDATGSIQNPNPITFSSGARATIWLTNGAFYKFVLCLQNDGPTCAPADVLFSVDQVPGGSSGGGGGGGGSPFISGSANPATTGILRLASGDAICWRNAANSSNLCVSKDTNDVLTWAGGAVKFPEIACSSTSAGYDYFCSDSSSHRWKMANNGGSQLVIAAQGQDINASDFVTQLHFGSTALPLSSTPPSTGQFLLWNGTNVVGASGPESTMTAISGSNLACAAGIACPVVILSNSHTLLRVVANVYQAGTGCGTNTKVGLTDLTSSTVLAQITVSSTGIVDSGALSVAMTAGHQFGLGETVAPIGCSQFAAWFVTATYQ